MNSKELQPYELEYAQRRVKLAGTLGFWASALTAMVGLVAFFTAREVAGFDGSAVFDAAFMALLAWRTYREKRFSALFLTLYYVVSKVIFALDSGKLSGGAVWAMVLGYFFVRGTIAAFAIHGHKVATGTVTDAPVSKVLLAGASVATLVFFVLLVIGTMNPGSGIIAGAQMKKKHVAAMQRMKLLSEGENIVLFFSNAFLSFEDELCFFTPQRLVIHNAENVEVTKVIPLEAITELVLAVQPEYGTRRLFVHLRDEPTLSLDVPDDDDGGQRFHAELQKRIESLRVSRHGP